MLGGSGCRKEVSEVAKAPLCWRKVVLGKLEKVKCSVRGDQRPVGLGHRSWQQSCLPDWRVMDKALTHPPGDRDQGKPSRQDKH